MAEYIIILRYLNYTLNFDIIVLMIYYRKRLFVFTIKSGFRICMATDREYS